MLSNNLIIALMTLTILSGCCATNNTTNATESAEEMMKSGFVMGELVFSDVEGDCEYTIQTYGSEPELLDPTNLDDAFKADGIKVWVKYISLRMANRCDKARPIEIIEIQKREK